MQNISDQPQILRSCQIFTSADGKIMCFLPLIYYCPRCFQPSYLFVVF